MKPKNSKKYHYFYKIINNLNNHFYYGIHSTNNLNDGYMGSGTRLRYAYNKYGIENFSKSIIKFFNSREDAAMYEAEIVSETLVKDENCYNVILGGEKWNTTGTAAYIDENNNVIQLPVDDIRVLTGKVNRVCKGKVTVKDSNGKTFRASTDDPRYLSGELVPNYKGLVTVKDNNGNTCCVSVDDPRYLSGELVHIAKDTLLVKDKNNNYFCVSVDDPRYLSGEFKPFWCGHKHDITTIEKMKKTHQDNKHQQGEKNSQYGTCWIMKDGSNKKIKKDELNSYLQLGWVKGRKCNKTK